MNSASEAAANLGIALVEVNNGEAILRSATELQPTGTLRMPIHYRDDCAYTFVNGKLHLHVVMSVGVHNHVGLTSVLDTGKRELCSCMLKRNNFIPYYSVCVLFRKIVRYGWRYQQKADKSG